MAMDRKTCFDCRVGERSYPIIEGGPKRLCMHCSIDRELIPFRRKLRAIIERGEENARSVSQR